MLPRCGVERLQRRKVRLPCPQHGIVAAHTVDQQIPAALVVQRHDTGATGRHRDQERHQCGLARPSGAGDQGVADVAHLPVEAIGRAGQGAEDRDRRSRPVPALRAGRPVVERRKGNKVRRLHKPRPRPPERATGQHRQVGRLQRVGHPGRDQPARGEVTPCRIADLRRWRGGCRRRRSAPGYGRPAPICATSARRPHRSAPRIWLTRLVTGRQPSCAVSGWSRSAPGHSTGTDTTAPACCGRAPSPARGTCPARSTAGYSLKV